MGILRFGILVHIFVMQGFSGLSLFSVLLLMALGLAIIFGQMGVINMAHGEFMTIGAYTTVMLSKVAVQYEHGFLVLLVFLRLRIAVSFAIGISCRLSGGDRA
ncbi:MAG: hypothetical protein MPW16_15830 [Candidatus Manganitrophus sp.]|nr:MAG: hypothetical protein MPW16_15830 [Candidatus Manganitrophus sp.]